MNQIEMNPLVSVLMTAFNREKYIADAIESVLNSTFKDFELIIVDDCSNDGTMKIARYFETKDQRVKVYRNEQNLGDYLNRNKAASYAKGEYLKYLDSDDIMYPHCLQVMVSSMEKYPYAGFGFSAMDCINEYYPVCIGPRDIYLEHYYGFGHFNRGPGSSIIRRSVFMQEGGFSGKKYIGDSELWFSLAQKYHLVKFSRDLYWNRIHENTESNYEKRDGQIQKMRQRMELNYLRHNDCPLTQNEVKRILREKRTIFILCTKFYSKLKKYF